MQATMIPTWTPKFSPWRHGGWYVDNIHYPAGGVGCVSRNFVDRKWRIVCDPRPFETAPTFKSRDEAARAERELTIALGVQSLLDGTGHTHGDGVYNLDLRDWRIERDGAGVCWRSDCDRGVKA